MDGGIIVRDLIFILDSSPDLRMLSPTVLNYTNGFICILSLSGNKLVYESISLFSSIFLLIFTGDCWLIISGYCYSGVPALLPLESKDNLSLYENVACVTPLSIGEVGLSIGTADGAMFTILLG